jgi:hypothetical protein
MGSRHDPAARRDARSSSCADRGRRASFHGGHEVRPFATCGPCVWVTVTCEAGVEEPPHPAAPAATTATRAMTGDDARHAVVFESC